MKKSKVIIPALAMLVLSTAASVTGTVAWFTANRTATITTGNFAVVKTDGTLDVSCTYGVGTAVTTDGSGKNTIVNPVTDAKIGDISFNPATKQLWNDTGAGTAFRTIGDNTSYRSQPVTNGSGTHAWKINDKTYHAFTWKITVSYEWGADYTPLNIMFDWGSSAMTATSQSTGRAHTKFGFRIALIGMTDASTPNHTVVWSKLSDADRAATDLDSDGNTTDPGEAASKFSAVVGSSEAAQYGADSKSTDNDNYSYFGTDVYALGGTAIGSATAIGSWAKATDGDANQDQREDYLGTITRTGDESTSSMAIWCVAWYEGTDSSIVSDADLAQVSSTVALYATLDA